MNKRIIQMSSLGSFGRFGNQLFQYCFAKAYAKKTNATLEIPKDWVGRKIFKISDPPISRKLPKTSEDSEPRGNVNVDLFGYFQSQEFINYYTREEVKEWLQIQDRWTQKNRENFYIAAHIRRGDYLKFSHIYCLVKEESYIRAMVNNGFNPKYVVWVSEDNPCIEEETIKEGVPFLSDFLRLMYSNVLFRSNSTFPWWAAVLGNPRVFSPVVGDKMGFSDVEFVEGNHPKFLDVKNHSSNTFKHSDLYLREK